MEDVSDPPFRRLCKMHGADMMYSEFISSEGLIRDAIKSRMKLDIRLLLLEFKFCPLKLFLL
jgi:tRNA-dihydrouridine synthase